MSVPSIFAEGLLDGHLFHEAHIHVGGLLAVAQLDGGVEQIAHIIHAAPDLGHAAVDVQQRIDSSMPVRMEYSVVKIVSRGSRRTGRGRQS